MNQHEVGRQGEAIAQEFLQAQGYTIIEINYRVSFGEIDVIAHDGETLCFIEVKTRENDDYGHPFEAVTRSKQKTIRRVAQSYIMDNEVDNQDMRFDVVGVLWQDNGSPRIELVKNAFY